jgi:TolB protein
MRSCLFCIWGFILIVVGASFCSIANSDNEQWILFDSDRDGASNLYLMRPDGTGLHQLTAQSSWDCCGTFSPDGRTIAFSSNRAGRFSIYTLDVATEEVVRLIASTYDAFYPQWSPDGRTLAFAMQHPVGGELYTYDLDTEELARLTDNSVEDVSPVWSPDGARLAYISGPIGSPQLWILDLASSSSTLAVDDYVGAGYPRWSPDGKSILFSATGPGLHNSELFILNTVSSEVQQITNHRLVDEFGIWSPLGDQVVFNSYRTGNPEVFVLELATGILRQLTSNSAGDTPSDWCRCDGAEG